MRKILFIIICLCGLQKIQAQTNWQLLNPKPTANTGKDIHFVSSNIGYIITSNEILETLDAGVSWRKKQNISSGNDMSFYNTTGYIVGNSYILKSSDNGNSWTQVSTGFTGDFNTVSLINESTIIISSANTIIKSFDGGSTWVSLSVPNVTVNKTFFVNTLIGHAACNNGTMLKTIDGGQSWYTTQSTNSYPSSFFTVYFVNENIGFSTREHDNMYKTTDGGETWVEVLGINDAIYSFHFLDENTGYITGEYGVVFKTTDGGITWTWISFQNGRYGNTSMYGVYFQDGNTGYATGARGRIIKTIDGGTTWTENSPTYNDINQIKFLTNNVGYTLVGNVLFKTIDGGDSWNNIGSPVENAKTGRFDFINENLGYALVGGAIGTSGNTGSVYKTINGGINWTQTNNSYELFNENLYSIDFINENIGYVSGGFNQRIVMKTTDSGTTWSQVESISFGQIQFLNSQVGYANRIGYSGGRMYKTTDGGNTWIINFEVDKNINSFHFLDENNGYFVGDNAVMYKTVDGGASWQKLTIPYGYYELVKFYSNNVGYIANEDGRMYKTMNGGVNWELLTVQYGLNSIEFVNDNIFTAGSNGRIYKSDVEYAPVVLHVNQAENISNSSVTLTGNAASNEGLISNIQFEYSIYYSFNNIISTIPDNISVNESVKVSIDLTNLNQSTTYYYRLKGTYNSVNYTSEILSFTTLPDYELTTNNIYNYSATTAELTANLISNENNLTNVEFQYGMIPDALNNSIKGTPLQVIGNTTNNIISNLDNLEPETTYYVRVKATHQGVDVFGEIKSFTTYPEYYINLNNPSINGNNVTLSARISSYSQDITNIVFEYGTIDFENNIATSPNQVIANSTGYVNTTISNVDPNLTYYYRLKATYGIDNIYSEEGVFNTSGEVILSLRTPINIGMNSIELSSFIYSKSAYLTNIHFEYGITESLGLVISGNPNYAYGYNKVTAIINDLLPNQTYFYRLVATYNGNILYSSKKNFKNSTDSDDDNDGVSNANDTCPNTPAGQTVNATGCSQNQIDDDGDGVTNTIDTCPNTPTGEAVNAAGCSQSQIDDDGDGVMNDKDLCPNTPSGTNVNANGCFFLPANNFTIEVTGETCTDKNNGKISISAQATHNYVATLKGANHNFINNNLSVSNLAPGTYNVCIKITGITYEQCFTITIAEGKTVSGKSSVTSNKTSIDIAEGTAPYHVSINGINVLNTLSPSFMLDVKHGDIVEVKTAVLCEGVFSKTIDLFENIKAYPNPTKSVFEITLPFSKKEVYIELFTVGSQLISKGSYQVVNGKVQLNLENKPTGVYVVKIYLDTPVSLTIIKE